MTLLRTLVPALATASAVGVYYGIRSIKAAPLSVVKSTLFAPFESNAHMDVYQATMDAPVDLPKFASCFFRSPVFQAERLVLRLCGYGAMSDADIDALAFTPNDDVVVFHVVESTPDEIVMAWKLSPETHGNSWLHLGDDGRTVYFGSTFNPTRATHKAILPFHLLYAQIVLAAARYQYNKETLALHEP
ncbi:hypothetical protein ACHHYP_15881 [Achlya hypogyna]|uniref:Secreted protein n=1 Tax=Achlya hypogyna TaxID=1202772 RepID=A0A0A7CPK8_ACHHY|nr:secreted protein [Achlya hypogyna]OQR82540.1 hypothetical protein ACHHYP_15881 [Achlya hypogyna]